MTTPQRPCERIKSNPTRPEAARGASRAAPRKTPVLRRMPGAALAAAALLALTAGAPGDAPASPKAAGGCPLASTRVFMAASAGSAAFAAPAKNFPKLMSTPAVGLSLTNYSIAQIIDPPEQEKAPLRGDAAFDATLAAWRPGHALALGAFFSPALTPSVPADHYAHSQEIATETALTSRLLETGVHLSLIELDVSLSRLPRPPGTPMSDAQLADVKLAVADLRRLTSTKLIMLWLSPNDGSFGDFATSPIFAAERAAALAAGGIAFDTPANFWFAVGPGYHTTTISEIRWARAHGVQTMFAVSPFSVGAGGTPQFNYDPQFLEATQKIYDELSKADALPNYWMAANYTPAESAEANRPWTETKPESVAQVALWFRDHARTQPPPADPCAGPSPH